MTLKFEDLGISAKKPYTSKSECILFRKFCVSRYEVVDNVFNELHQMFIYQIIRCTQIELNITQLTQEGIENYVFKHINSEKYSASDWSMAQYHVHGTLQVVLPL